MKRLLLSVVLCAFTLFACNNEEKNIEQNVDNISKENIVEVGSDIQKAFSADKYFDVESGYIKYNNNAAGQEMTRELWFDQFGKLQYEENYFFIAGTKYGSKTLVLDGYSYSWDYDNPNGRKFKHYMAATDYDNVSDKDIERYGIKKLGYENVLGKNCLKVSTEKPAKSTSWVWNKIPLKTVAVFGGKDVIMEALKIEIGSVDANKFVLPKDVVFAEAN